jgi:hypothetical protein
MAVHVNCIFKFKRCTKYIGHVSHNSYKIIAFQNDTNEVHFYQNVIKLGTKQ